MSMFPSSNLSMAEVKSPFRLWLDNEDSQCSVALPSPRLVERLGVPSPLLLGATEEREESRGEGTLRLQFVRERKPDGGKRAVSPICTSVSPLRRKRLTHRRPDYPVDSSRKHRSSTANRKLFLSNKHPTALFTPTSPKSVHLTPKPHTLHPYLTIASPHKEVEVRTRLHFPSPKGEARPSARSKESIGVGSKRRRSVTPLSLLGSKRVG